jgi:hypothetical protein
VFVNSSHGPRADECEPALLASVLER